MCFSTLLHLDRDQKILLFRGFPIRICTGQRFIGSSPYSFVALTVLLRQYVPRHPPRALSRLSFLKLDKMNSARKLRHFKKPKNVCFLLIELKKQILIRRSHSSFHSRLFLDHREYSLTAFTISQMKVKSNSFLSSEHY